MLHSARMLIYVVQYLVGIFGAWEAAKTTVRILSTPRGSEDERRLGQLQAVTIARIRS